MARLKWGDHIFQVKIWYSDGERKCRRRIIVPGKSPLFIFQQIILRSFGLGQLAMHYFTQGRETYVPDGVYIKGNSRGETDWDLHDLLGEVKSKAKFIFEHGKIFEVVFSLEKTFRPDEREFRIECLDGVGWLPGVEPKRRAGDLMAPDIFFEADLKKINRELRGF